MKILVADDDATTRFRLRSLLSKRGHELVETSDGEAAWEHFCAPDPAGVGIIDWVMPGISGPELCHKIKARGKLPAPYLILLTCKSDPKEVAAGLEAGADDFVVKPCATEELLARVAAGTRIVRLQTALRDANTRLEERIERRTQQLRRLLGQMENLLHHLSHDLRTPLTPLLSMLTLLSESESDPERGEMLSLALDGARTVDALSTGVLELCRAASSRPSSSPTGESLARLADHALTECRTALDGRVVRSEVPVSCRIWADPLQVRRVLASLLDNSLKFTAPGGTVALTASTVGTAVNVSVTDDGIGLTPDQLTRVFEPFYRADPSRHDRGSVGLGLSIARVLVEGNGGRMWAESPGPGRGTTLHFTLPSASEPSLEPNRL